MVSGGRHFSIKFADRFCGFSRRNIDFYLCDDMMVLVNIVTFDIEAFQLSGKSASNAAISILLECNFVNFCSAVCNLLPGYIDKYKIVAANMKYNILNKTKS